MVSLPLTAKLCGVFIRVLPSNSCGSHKEWQESVTFGGLWSLPDLQLLFMIFSQLALGFLYNDLLLLGLVLHSSEEYLTQTLFYDF